jgi:hypothetical protein
MSTLIPTTVHRDTDRHRTRSLSPLRITALAAALLMVLPASANELGSRDLDAMERQLQTMERSLQEQRREIEALRREQAAQREQQATLSAAAESAPERAIRSGNDAVKLSISGQINRGVMIVDDGDSSRLFNIDNNASSSRIRAIGEARPAPGVMIGSALEVEFRVNNSFTVSQFDRRSTDTSAFRNRRVEVFADHERLGRLWLGMGWTATEFVAEQDLSGTALAGYSDPRVMGGGMFFRDKNTGELSDIRMLDVSDNMDGFGRDTRIRYDTPRFGGVQLRTSVVNDGAVDVALNYSGRLGPANVAAMAGWANFSERNLGPATFDDLIAGSASVLLDEGPLKGLNATIAAGRMDRIGSGPDAEFRYVKLGYQGDFFRSGKTALSIDFHQTDDLQQSNDRLRAYGLQAVHTIDNWGTDLYLNVRNHEFDRTGRNFDDLTIGMVGARVRF